MRTAVPRSWEVFEYFDAREVLIKLGEVERELESSSVPDRVIQLRTRALRPYHERRQAALFCYGLSCLLERPVAYAPVEDEDFDCVARWTDGDT